MATDDAPNLRRLARQLVDVTRRLKHLETVPQLAHSSLDNQGMHVYDAEGNVSVTLGKQSDGTYSARPVRGPIPPAPAGLDAEGDAGLVHASWRGVFWAGAAFPRDFEAVEVLVDGNVHGAIHDPDGGSVTVPAFAGEREVSFRTLSQAGRRSDATGHVTVTVQSKASVQLDEARGRIEDAEQSLADSQVRLNEAEQAVASTAEDLTRVETVVIPAAVQALEEADAAAQEQFVELDTRLGAFATDEALAPIRQALSDAQAAVETAQGVAESANQAANAASQAALEAAGIAASKGRVIIQETEPVGEDRNAANIWIKPIPDDPATEIEEKAITYVYLEGSNEWVPTSSDELAQAAQNALDAREAAQQAKQRADTAISNAAKAQGAAEAAQRTADAATTDAREAWNEAVAAQAAADAAKSAAANLVGNGSFEQGLAGWEASATVSVDTEQSHSGSQSARLSWESSSVTAEILWPEPVPVSPGQVWEFSAWVLHEGDDGNHGGLRLQNSADGSAWDFVSVNFYSAAGWRQYVHRYAVPEEGVAFLRARIAQQSLDDPIWVDDVSLRDVTDVVALEAAAQSAQARADEAMTEASEAKGLAEEAVREVGDTVRNTVIEYAVNTSETAAPTSGWSTSTPTRTPGSFVWMRTIVTYADGDTSTTSPALLTGNAGAKGDPGTKGDPGSPGVKGDPGAQGVGVSSVSPFFRAVSRTAGAPAQPSGMTPSGWVTTEPAWNSSRKLYRAERIVYSNGTVSWTVPTLVAAYEGIVQVQTSVNGKNSITRSTSNASGSGVVAGDAWYKVDSNGDTMAMWIWDGSKWVASKVRNEMIDTVDVNKLKVHNDLEVVGDAVINKLWADGISAKSLTASRVVVASSNAYRDPAFNDSEPWLTSSHMEYVIRGGYGPDEHGVRVTGGSGQRGGYDLISPMDGFERTELEPGQTYSVSVWATPSAVHSGRGAAVYIRPYTTPTTTTAEGVLTAIDNYGMSNGWNLLQGEFTMPEDARWVSVGLYINPPFTGSIRFSTLSIRPKVGAVLIEDGAITTPKLTVTGEMSAAIVNAMTTNTKKLVVTEEAILNHATLIGDTVVDNINVTGKLIGTDGVFTGTVDFENVNVTGLQLVEKLEAHSISADLIEGGAFTGESFTGGTFVGGEFRTSDTLPGRVTLADDAYVSSYDGGARPGISVEPEDSTRYSILPGVGPESAGMTIDGGKLTTGEFSYITMFPAATTIRSHRPDGAIGGEIQTTPTLSTMRTYSGNSLEKGWVQVNPQDAELAYVAPDNTYVSRIRADASEAFLYTRAGGTYRYLSVDADGIWVKTYEGGSWKHYNLEETAQDSGWQPIQVLSGYTAQPNYEPKARKVGNLIYLSGGINGSGIGANTSQDVMRLPASFRPVGQSIYVVGGSSYARACPLVVIRPDGIINVRTAPDTGNYYLLDGLSFIPE